MGPLAMSVESIFGGCARGVGSVDDRRASCPDSRDRDTPFRTGGLLMLTLEDRLAGAVWGHLVGDAVGVPYEFGLARPAETVVFGHTGMYGQPPGTWSDDGALMLALLDSLLTTGFDTADQGRRAVAWFNEQAYTPDHDGRFDVGNVTAAALRAIQAGTRAEDAGPTHDRASGNGSLMRILGLALVERGPDEILRIRHAHRASRVTHGTAHAQVACALYVLIVGRLLTRDEPLEATLKQARATLRGAYVGHDMTEHIDAFDHLEAHRERGGHGRVWDSFWSAWDAFAGAADYRSTIQRAVAYGNDTDTTAAIAGGLAGARWGLGGIPAEWLGGMRGKAIAQPLIDRLVATTDKAQIRVDEVPLSRVPGLIDVTGRLGMTFLPGKHGVSGRAGEHRRDLATDIATLRRLGVETLVVLVEDDELAWAGVADIVERMAEHGIDTIRHPIPDRGVPTDPSAFADLLATVTSHIRDGRFVAVACMGGLGRTGTLVACLLKDSGLDADQAMELTRLSRRGTIENTTQETFVRSWPNA